MLRSLNDLEHYTVHASDGDVGQVANFLMDDDHWVIRYLVVATGGFFSERKVLISPVAFGQAEWASQRFQVDLTRGKILHAPDVDTDQPVSRQHERDQFRYYGYPDYWGSSGIWGMAGAPGPLAAAGVAEKPPAPRRGAPDDLHLRSAREVCGYHIQGSDDGIGHVQDFIVDDETWEVRYLVIDTSNLWFGRKVLVSPWWASSVSWEHRKVYLDLSREEIRDSPEWNPDAGVNREYETCLYDYYGRPAYWATAPHPQTGVPRPPLL